MRLFKFEESVGKMLAHKTGQGCPSIDELVELAERGSKAHDYGARMEHVATCGDCFPLFRELKHAEIERKRDSIGWFERLRGFKVKGSSAYESSVRLPEWVGGFLKELCQAPPPAAVYRNAGQPPVVRLINPDPTSVSLRDDTAVFSWESKGSFVGFEVELQVEGAGDFHPVPGALTVQGTVARLKDGFKFDRSRRYRLIVRPQQSPDDWSLPPADSVYSFNVLGKRESLQANWAIENQATAPISAAMVLYQLGCYSDAARIAQGWPKDEASAEWSAAILSTWESRKLELGLLD